MEVYIIMRKSLLKLDTDELLQKDDPPTPQRIVEFIDSSLPIGMGGFVLGSKLYFAGGEKIKKGFALRNSYNTSKVLKYEDDDNSDWPSLNSKVFLFQPTASSSAVPLTLMHKIAPMNQPKTKPMVTAVEGKIYILSSEPYVLRDNEDIYPYPFECLDPITNTWEVLPEPPNFSSHRCAHNLEHLFVSGSRIFVKNPLGIQFFDVHARRWFEKKEVLAELQIDKSVCSKWMGWVSLAEGDEGIAIAYANGQGLIGYEYETDPATTIRREQLLDKVNERLPSATSCDEGCEEGFVQHLGNNRFCFIVSVRKKESPWCVLMFIFEVTRVGLDGPCFLDIQLLREHCYDFMKLTSFDFGSIQDVVFMHKSQKRVRRLMKGRGILSDHSVRKCG